LQRTLPTQPLALWHLRWSTDPVHQWLSAVQAATYGPRLIAFRISIMHHLSRPHLIHRKDSRRRWSSMVLLLPSHTTLRLSVNSHTV
jgi:hypothetical protein